MSRTASPPAFITLPSTSPDDCPPSPTAATDKISAYYSLVFPKFTYYLQTLSVTIGRRCGGGGNGAGPSDPTPQQVDVDLGNLKSVSRLHARIEYEEDEERFVLAVLGRNGAWVDGAWSGKGSKVPLGERSQIQIASRTFHFVLPPPPAPDDSPSPPSSHPHSRSRSPSVDVDVTGLDLTPPSSIPSISPPPPRSPETTPATTGGNGKGKGKKHKPPPHHHPPTSSSSSDPSSLVGSSSQPPPQPQPPKKDKDKGKGPTPPSSAPPPAEPPLRPEDMPPKPNFTYAQLCYRAIKSMQGRGTLQEIVRWMVDNHDWYRFNQGSGWEKSVRHNLSSNRAFRKVERRPGERGKGYYWTVEPAYEPMFEEQEARAASAGKAKAKPATSATTTATVKSPSTTPAAVMMKPALTPAPVASPPAPPPMPRISPPKPPPPQSTKAGPSTSPPASTPISGPHSTVARPPSAAPIAGPSSTAPVAASAQAPSTTVSAATTAAVAASASTSSLPTIPPSIILPIIISPLPPSAAAAHPPPGPHLPAPPIVLHENTLILCPEVFGHLSKEEVERIEKRGAQGAIEELQGVIVRFLKERIRRERGKKRRKREGGGGKDAGGSGGAVAKVDGRAMEVDATGKDVQPSAGAEVGPENVTEVKEEEVPGSPIVVVDDDEDEVPAAKRRKVGA